MISWRSHTIRSIVALALCVVALTVIAGCSPSGPLQGRYAPSANTPAGGLPLSASQPTAPPIPLSGKVLPATSGAYLGVYVPPAPFDPARVDAFEKTVGKGVSIVMWYQPWATNNRFQFDSAACVEIMRRGKVPMITWEPWDPGTNANALRTPADQPQYRLSAITSGQFDGYIRTWAQDLRSLGGPVMLRPMHEMNGNWYPWCGVSNGNTPAEFIAAWRHIHDIFQQEGATNVTWVWSINDESRPGTTQNRFAAYYPGDQYVDWTAISGFNWGTSIPGTSWLPYSYWYTKPITYLKTLHKPICIAEFASVEKGGNKAAWLTNAYAQIAANPSVKAIVYYDALERGGVNAQDWRVDTTPASLAAFRRAIAPAHFLSGRPDALTTWAASLTPPTLEELSAFEPIY
jgi:mannan endo-1,4-beta-mannosidase